MVEVKREGLMVAVATKVKVALAVVATATAVKATVMEAGG